MSSALGQGLLSVPLGRPAGEQAPIDGAVQCPCVTSRAAVSTPPDPQLQGGHVTVARHCGVGHCGHRWGALPCWAALAL